MSKYCAYIPSSHLDSQNSQIFFDNNLFAFIMELSSQYSIWQGESDGLWRNIHNQKVAIKNLKNFLNLNRFIVPSTDIQNWQTYDLYLSMARKRNNYVYFVEELDFYFVVCGQVLYAYSKDKIPQKQLSTLATKYHLSCIVDDTLPKAQKPRFSTRAIHYRKLQKLIDENMQTIMLKYFGISPDLEDIRVYNDFDSQKYITQYAECFYVTLWSHWLSASEREKCIQDYVFDRGALKSDVQKMEHRMQCEQKLLDFMLWIYKSFSVYKSGIHRYKDAILLYQTSYDEFVLDFYRLVRNGGGFWWYIAEEKTWAIASEEYALTFISFGNATKIKNEAKNRDLFILH